MNKHNYYTSIMHRALDKYGNVNPNYTFENSVEALLVLKNIRSYCCSKSDDYLNISSKLNKGNMIAALIVIVISGLSIADVIETSIPIIFIYLPYLLISRIYFTKYINLYQKYYDKAMMLFNIIHTLPHGGDLEDKPDILKYPISNNIVVYELLKEIIEEDNKDDSKK